MIMNLKIGKCFVYPYNYLYVTNNNGNDNIYKYENFSSEKCYFRNEIALSVGCSARTIPLLYKRVARNDDESLPLGKYPTCQWSTDSFTSWLTSQAVNIPMSITNSIIGSAQSFAQGDLVGTGVSIANSVGGLIGQFYSASLVPNVSHGGNTGDIVYASNRNTFVYRSMRVKTENLKIIDDYFSRFGYAMKRVLLPNITGRKNWNYVEIGSSEEIGYGSVPSKYMQQINNACRKGVTIWHNHSNLGNFSLDNSII